MSRNPDDEDALTPLCMPSLKKSSRRVEANKVAYVLFTSLIYARADDERERASWKMAITVMYPRESGEKKLRNQKKLAPSSA